MSDSEIAERLESPNNLMNKLVEIRKMGDDRGKRGGDIGVRMKELIGGLANESKENQTAIAEVFGVGQSVVSESSRGLVHTRFDKSLAEKVGSNKATEKKLETAHELALDAMVESLTAITPEKLNSIDKPERLARIAESMSRIAGTIRGNNEEAKGNKVAVQVVLFQPRGLKKEEEYETVVS